MLILKSHCCSATAFLSHFPKGHHVSGGGPTTLIATTHFPLIALLPFSWFYLCREATSALFIPEMHHANGGHKSNKSCSRSLYWGERSMGFNERTGSQCAHCNLLAKQWIVLSRLTKPLFFAPLTFFFFFEWRIQWRGLSIVINRPWNG